MRGSLWWQLATAIVVVLVAIGIRSSTSQDDPPTQAPEPRQTLNIDFVAVLHVEGQPWPYDSDFPTLPTVYKEIMSDEFRKWYPMAEDKTRAAIVGNKDVNGTHEWSSILEWTTDSAKWETHIGIAYLLAPFDFSVANALKFVQERVLSGDSTRPKVVLFVTFDSGNSVNQYKFDEAKERLNSLKNDGVLLLSALEAVFFGNEAEGRAQQLETEAKFDEFFGSANVYHMSSPHKWWEKIKFLPAWIESRVISTFCNESYQKDACFFNPQHQCKHGKYHSKVPLAVGDCEALNHQLPSLAAECDDATCEGTCDRLWPTNKTCSGSTCGDKAPKRHGQPNWNQLKNCPAEKLCPECFTTVSQPSTTSQPTTTSKPGGGAGIIEGPVVQQLIIAFVISTWSMLSG